MARLLASDHMRELMKYRHEYQHEVGIYKDYFDGEEYQDMLANTELFSSEHDVALALFVDGFRADKADNGCKLAILHLLNLNPPPHLRYQKQYIIQLGILPGYGPKGHQNQIFSGVGEER